MTDTYDSAPDTRDHIYRVAELLQVVRNDLYRRSIAHDQSKLQEPEKSIFDRYTPLLKGSTYGSDEYKQFLAEMKPALDHHYARNAHHPEHHKRGIWDMSLLDVIEMLCDWKAAGERHADGNMQESIRINRLRFGIDEQLHMLLLNTAKELGWLE